jgi:hypothetical protein
MWQEFLNQLNTEFLAVFLVCTTGLVIFTYMFYLLKIQDDKTVDLRDLVLDSKTRRLDYKKLAINTCAILQCYTWWRLSNDLPVSGTLDNPTMWVVFYAVVAGHDLLYRMVKIKAAQAGVDVSGTSDSGNSK